MFYSKRFDYFVSFLSGMILLFFSYSFTSVFCEFFGCILWRVVLFLLASFLVGFFILFFIARLINFCKR